MDDLEKLFDELISDIKDGHKNIKQSECFDDFKEKLISFQQEFENLKYENEKLEKLIKRLEVELDDEIPDSRDW